MKLVKTLVWGALVYGADAWTLCKADENRIMAAEMWFWKCLLKISWKQKRTNTSVLNELGVKRDLLGKIATLKICYFGHILRGGGSPLTLQIKEGMMDRKRRREGKRNNCSLITSENGQECAIPKPSTYHKRESMEKPDQTMCRCCHQSSDVTEAAR